MAGLPVSGLLHALPFQLLVIHADGPVFLRLGRGGTGTRRFLRSRRLSSLFGPFRGTAGDKSNNNKGEAQDKDNEPEAHKDLHKG